MKNQEIAKIFYEIANYLEMEEVAFRPYAYKRVANTLGALEENVEDIYKQGGLKGLKEIPGVGENIALKIEEYLKTGRIKYYEKLKKKNPINLKEIIAVQGMGPRKARNIYKKLKIKNIKDVGSTDKNHKITPMITSKNKQEKKI